MTKVKDVEAAAGGPEPGWAKAMKTGFLQGGGGGGVPAGVVNTSDNLLSKSASGKNRGTSGSTEEELKLLGSTSSPDGNTSSSSGGTSVPPKIVHLSTVPAGGAKEFLRSSCRDDDFLDTSNNATLTVNGISALDDHTTTYTGTINSLSKIKNRFSSKYGRMRKRVVFKNGDTNLHQTNISKRRRKYLADLFITLVDLQVHNIYIFSLRRFIRKEL